ncbi:MAG: HEAT repeat protein [Chlamydiales bacterium]|jgi:HEAT repeat protein
MVGSARRRLSIGLLAGALLTPIAAAGDVADVLRGVDTEAAAVAAQATLAQADLAEVFQVLADGTLPLPGIDPDEVAFGTMVATALTDLQRQCARDAVSAMPATTFRQFLIREVTPETSRGMRKTALQLLTPMSERGDLAYGLALAEDDLPRLARDFEAFVASLLVHDAQAYSLVQAQLATKNADLRAALIRGIGAAGDERGLRLLNRFLFGDDDHIELLLEQVARLARSNPQSDVDTVATSVRHFLTSDEPNVVAAAALALGAFSDSAAIPELIELADHDSGSVRAGVKSSLRELTGMRFPTSRRWFLWYEAEREWWDTRWPSLASGLRSADRETITSLLAETIGKRLERDWLATEVSGLLAHDDELVRRLACQNLGQLGTDSVIPDLLGAMTDFDEAVAKTAWQSLREVTQMDLPFDSAACSQILEEARDQ